MLHYVVALLDFDPTIRRKENVASISEHPHPAEKDEHFDRLYMRTTTKHPKVLGSKLVIAMIMAGWRPPLLLLAIGWSTSEHY